MRMFVDMEVERERDDNRNDNWCEVVRKLADEREEENLPLAYTDIPFHAAAYGFTATAKGIVEDTLRRCHNRRFFVTDTGVIGVGPVHLQLGDSLYRCFGVDVTFAFRDDDKEAGEDGVKRVTLIGECYVIRMEQEEEEEERDVGVSVEEEDGREVLVIEAREEKGTGDGEMAGEVLECLHIV